MNYLKEILPKIIRYRLARKHVMTPGLPLNLTFSVTNVCQSRCRTCRIWDLYRRHPERRDQELTLAEIENIFRRMGHIYIFNVSGGEPFLRPDLFDIIRLACRFLTPGIVHIPTNAIAVDRIEGQVRKIAAFLQRSHPAVRLTVKPSLDHIGPRHDEIRGVKGNFKQVMALFRRLKALQAQYKNLHVELGTVISRWNVADIEEIATFVASLGSDSYRNEIAEQRSEMFNADAPITPPPEAYAHAIDTFVARLRGHMKRHRLFQRITGAFRLVYYAVAVRILKEKRQVIPCYAGISNAHISAYGDVWACCTLGYEKSMGSLRDHGYDFAALWNGPQAETVRAYIQAGNCCCPLANQTYSNILLHAPSLVKVLRGIFLN